MSKEHWGEGTLFLRGQTYWIQYSVNGRRRRESTKTADVRKARKVLREKLASASRGELPETNVRIGRLLDNLLRFYETNRPKSAAWAKIVVEVHLRKPFEFVAAATLGTKALNDYIDARRAEGIRNGTINRELAILRRSYSLGLNHEPPLVHRVPRIPELSEGAPRAGFFEAPDFDRLCAELPADVRDVALFAYWTGCRKGEILGLRWAQVDFADRVVRLEITKSGEPREIPLSSELFEILIRRRDERAANWPWCQWVFSRDGKRIVNFYTSWNSACERAKLDGSALLHDLRRTGVRNLVRAGVPEKVAMLISGHKTRSVFDRYHIVQGDDLKDAMQKLEKHLGRKK